MRPREANMLRLVYTSKPYGSMEDSVLDALVEQSRRKNYKSGITGVLHFGNGSFIQVLEGPEIEVINLYSKIVRDPRHRNCVILNISLVQERLFGNWSMGFISGQRKITHGYNELLDYRQVHHGKAEISAVLDLLLEVLRD